MEVVAVNVSTPGAIRPMVTFPMLPHATVSSLKDSICESMRVLVQEQRLLAGQIGQATEPLDDARTIWDLRAQVGDPVSVTLVVVPLHLLVLSGGGGSTPRSKLSLWDADTGQALHDLPYTADTVLCAAADWTGQRALSGGWEGVLRLWDLACGSMIRELPASAPAGSGFQQGHAECGVLCLAADWAAQRALCGGQDGMLRLWDLQNCVNLMTFQGHPHPIFCVAIDWASRRAVSGAQDRTLRYWSLSRPDGFMAQSGAALMQELRGHSGTVFCVDVDWTWHKAISGSWDCTLRLWDLQRGEALQELRGHSNAVFCVVMDWQAQQAVSGSSDSVIIVWDLNCGAMVRQLRGHAETVTCLEVDWASQKLLSGSSDGTLRLWSLESGEDRVVQVNLEDIRCVKARWHGVQGASATGWARSKMVPR